jgi:4-coumarate--CoA ligase
VLTYGTLWANGVVSPANAAGSASDLAFQLSDSGAKALLTQAHSLKTAFEAAKTAGIPRNRILLIGDGRDKHVQHFTDFIKAPNSRVVRRKSATSDLAFIPYSSGTTGLPKGVMLTHRNMVSNVLQIEAGQNEISENSTVIAVLPFYHIYGKSTPPRRVLYYVNIPRSYCYDLPPVILRNKGRRTTSVSTRRILENYSRPQNHIRLRSTSNFSIP